MKIITILYPAMCFKEQSKSCAIITTRYIGQDQLKVEIEHDPLDCYGGNGIHSDQYYDEKDQAWEFDNDQVKFKKTMK